MNTNVEKLPPIEDEDEVRVNLANNSDYRSCFECLPPPTQHGMDREMESILFIIQTANKKVFEYHKKVPGVTWMTAYHDKARRRHPVARETLP